MVPIGELFKFYEEWAEVSGIKQTLNKKNFRSRLDNLGFQKGPRREARSVLGLQIDPVARADLRGFY